ncbi:Alpha-tocopherol transfer protein-like protein [Trachymyrmex septentrionalis]|uniref:Alpha-tocopherol transfer protein-like protein n=1 Tax=Trachymyrmex septentrionalis TaxID=34720 RepID=A0A195FFR6_9HYME|nr:PREDICTED: alpha-tocopherol transfer protein-like [Trachymyrmex septentrionalis]XP_018342006.1 PREDICTED: alpha-tocopherol transfer protein-like [Trachymyrmex septentrionalis]KYN39545.1 Alpha-tocopherol transfer protein-like protein [Trachymyrmex septentrionalis]
MTLLPPTPAQQKHIDKELPSDPEMRKQDIRALREWLSKQPHLPNHIDDIKLERFLFNCKNSIERCKLILERYYTVRTSLPEFFAIRDPLSQDIRDSFNIIDWFVLPSLTEEGYRVTIFRLRDTNVEKFSFQALAKRVLMILDTRLMEEFCLSNIMIADLEGLSMAHFAKIAPTQSIVRRAMLAIQDSMPFRLFSVHYLHAPSFITSLINVFYPLLKKKLTQKFHIFNGGAEELYVYINKDILPNEWGGKAGTFQELNDAWQKKIEKNRDWFLQDEKLSRTNENARLLESKSSYLVMNIEGIQGSFRKLNID